MMSSSISSLHLSHLLTALFAVTDLLFSSLNHSHRHFRPLPARVLASCVQPPRVWLSWNTLRLVVIAFFSHPHTHTHTPFSFFENLTLLFLTRSRCRCAALTSL
ncbi:hypothetical protein C8Q69DRAFT_472189 [Paecilomyces variotii]|uniref:Secreted protein n=1 Tax=Byssochlamys spectabilis TaxID=264951 RepID=A0A443HQB1_BYSSP|nr:hypothetical protein C8Q69DRAFT_472189 [Paecilomyces variotii]RWQ93974.1 hypothetical protein C8Q69DRAFT_472189 [Paecilomyces variotii]